LIVDHADKLVLEDKLLRLLTDFQRIEWIVGALRPRDEHGESEAGGSGEANAKRSRHGLHYNSCRHEPR
jgi:hypothetical protein